MSDIVSLHVHVTDETQNLIADEFLSNAKSNLILINTSRGEVVSEPAMIKFLENNVSSKYATDVIAEEYAFNDKHTWIQASKKLPTQLLITPHIGGMTKEAQEMAYCHAARMLLEYLLVGKDGDE